MTEGECVTPKPLGTEDHIRFRLYILRDTPDSTRALASFRAIADRYLSGRCELEVVDVSEDPLRALNDGVLMTPTLLRLSPPVRRIMGDLSETGLVLAALDLPVTQK